MRKSLSILSLILLAPLLAEGQTGPKVFKWVDAEGQVHYGDSIPAEYAELPKEVLNDRGVVVQNLEGRMSDEAIEEARLAEERLVERDKQDQADQALLSTYLSVEEILMHRDRRIELFQAQSKVTELYLSNLSRRLESLREDAARYQPYNEDPNAKMIPDDLAGHLKETEETIARHQRNLEKYQADKERIITRFAGQITRFKQLKGLE